MNLLALIALLTLSLTDPSGDAIGDGSLEPPTSPIYANAAQFDLLGVELYSLQDASAEQPDGGGAVHEGASRLTITMGSLSTGSPKLLLDEDNELAAEQDSANAAQAAVTGDDADPSALGEASAADQAEPFDPSSLLAVIDVYIGTGDGGLDRTLAGPNMLMPLGHGWRYALRVSADGVMAVTYSEAAQSAPQSEPGVVIPADGAPTDGATEADIAELDGAQPTSEGLPAGDTFADAPIGVGLSVEWLSVMRSGNTLIVDLPWAFDDTVELYALTGVHDPFATSGWRQLSAQPSPWAFSGDSQVSPVIDLLAPDALAQTAALTSGVLPVPPREQPGFSLPRTPWLYLMLGGILLAITGLVMRGRVPAASKAAAEEVEITVADRAHQEASDEAAANGDAEEPVVEVPVTVDEALVDESPVDKSLVDKSHLGEAQFNELPVDELPVDEPPQPEEAPPAQTSTAGEIPSPSDEPAPLAEVTPADEPPLPSEVPPGDEPPPPIEVPPGDEPPPPIEVPPVEDPTPVETPPPAHEPPPTEPPPTEEPPAGELEMDGNVMIVDEPTVTPEQAADTASAADSEVDSLRGRTLVGSKAERSYLGADNAGFGDESDEDDELDESFWHPRSRKPTLTGAFGGDKKTHHQESSKPRAHKVDNELKDR